MFHASEKSRLYNFNKGTQIDVILKSGKSEIDIPKFLDDISLWMENHLSVIKDKYLPFSCLAVGLVPTYASAFAYGCFVGRAMEKKKMKVSSEENPIDKKHVANIMKDDIENQVGWLRNMLKQIDKLESEEGKNDKV